jgi:hypothetical protein
VRFVAGVERDGCHGDVLPEKLAGRSLEAQAPVHLERRLTEHAPKHAVEMKGRQRSISRECGQIQSLVERLRDADNGHLHRRFVK